MKLEDLKSEKWCNCGHNEGHTGGLLEDGTDLIICNKCKGMVWINGKNKAKWEMESNV